MTTAETLVHALVSTGVPTYATHEVPDGQQMPYCTYGLKLTTDERADDVLMLRHDRYDVRLYCPYDSTAPATFNKVMDALESAGIAASAYTYDEPSEKDFYTVIETTVERG